MKSISIDEYIQLRKELEPSIDVNELRRNIGIAIRDKLEGYKCRKCSGELWAVGVLVSEDHLCYECIGLEPNAVNDIEFDVVIEGVY